jgi:dihydrolipoamide dehydrogenase
VQQQEEIFTFQGDAVLVAVGRRPYTSGLGLEKIGVAVTNKGFIEVDGNFRSSLPHILAIGDVIEGAMLAHRASGEGIAAAEVISGRHPHVNYIAIPIVIYTNPEVATVGLSDSEARNLGLEILVGNAFFKGNPRARCIGAPEGLIKVVAEAETQRLIGVHMMGPQVSEMIGQGVIALNTKATLSDIVYSSHAHPTLSEAFLDSCLNALGRPIH